ncbi:MAG: DUF4363 family protein [Syntrophomonas sp.]
MRLLESIIIILILIVCAGFWINHELQVSTQDLTRQIDRVGILVKESHWEAAVEQTEVLDKVWQQEAKWWPIFLEHQEMDNIEFSLAKFKEYVASKNNSLARGQLSEMKLMIEHIPRKEEINLKNIL